jgi:hypothetical protein
MEALKKAVSDGTYAVPAEDLAPKLIESMFQNAFLDETPIKASVSQLEGENQFNPSKNDGLKNPGGEMLSCRDSRLAAMPSDGSPTGGGTETWVPLRWHTIGNRRRSVVDGLVKVLVTKMFGRWIDKMLFHRAVQQPVPTLAVKRLFQTQCK